MAAICLGLNVNCVEETWKYHLSFLSAEIAQAVEILSHGIQGPSYLMPVNTMVADALVTKGAIMLLVLFSWFQHQKD